MVTYCHAPNELLTQQNIREKRKNYRQKKMHTTLSLQWYSILIFTTIQRRSGIQEPPHKHCRSQFRICIKCDSKTRHAVILKFNRKVECTLYCDYQHRQACIHYSQLTPQKCINKTYIHSLFIRTLVMFFRSVSVLILLFQSYWIGTF